MKRLFASAMLAGALLAGAPAANAATFMLTPVINADGSFSLGFKNDHVAGAGFADAREFEDIFEFVLPAELTGKLGGSITTIANTENDPKDKSNINFKFVMLNLSSFTMTPPGHQIETGALLPVSATPGLQRLIVHGFSGGGAAYGGNITFAPDIRAAVPEPAAWALMILGFGGAGAAIRSRRRGTAAHA
jgi:hypothetical protein